MLRQPTLRYGLNTLICTHNPAPSLSYGKGWWDGVGFLRPLCNENGLMVR